jgi:fructose-1,6-bisphosphatase II
MAETVDEAVDQAQQQPPLTGLCLCEQYVRVTEGGALTAARWLGRADQDAAEADAAAAMRAVLDDFPIQGRVVIGSAMEGSPLRAGEDIGAGGETVDLALDPLEGRGVVARGGNGAMSMIAVGERGSLLELPDMYMRKLAVGPRARGSIDLLKSMGENVQAIADAFGRRPNDITTIVLDRPRHHDLIEEIRASGARIKLIQDGTVTASISAAIRGTNDHMAVGIGGTRQAIMSAAALRCLGGELQAQLWPTSRREIVEARDARLHDGRACSGGGDRRRDGCLERGSAARRSFPHRLGAFPLGRHVHAVQLGALHRRDSLLRPRTARGSPAPGVLACAPSSNTQRSYRRSRHDLLWSASRAMP